MRASFGTASQDSRQPTLSEDPYSLTVSAYPGKKYLPTTKLPTAGCLGLALGHCLDQVIKLSLKI